jgi:hypothetical protein
MQLSRQALPFVVEVAGTVRDDLAVISVSQHIGGGQVDSALLRVVKHPHDESPVARIPSFLLQETALWKWAVNAPCRVFRKDCMGKMRLVHTGRIVAANADLSSSGEVLTLTSRHDGHLFGVLDQYPRRGARVDGVVGELCSVMGNITFNPVVDNVTIPNMYGGLYPEEGKEESPPEYIDPDSFPKRLYGQPIDIYRRWSPHIGYWTITDALFFIMESCLPEHGCQFIMPPTSGDIRKMMDPTETGVDRLEELTIDLSDPVPALLDKILSGTEYTWYIDYDFEPLPRITFISRAYPTKSYNFFMPKYGEPVHSETARAAVKSYSFQYDLANESANNIACLYGPLKVEVSIPLFPAWFKEYDDARIEDLTKNDSEGDMSPELGRVWRDWVANETGDYTTRLSERGLIPQGGRDLLIAAFTKAMQDSRVWSDDSEIDKDYLQRYPYARLPFEPCLTQGVDGSSIGDATGGVVLEYFIYGESLAWKPIEELFSSAFSVSVLRTECGIRFSSTEKPLEVLMAMRSRLGADWAKKFWIRATGTINFGNVLYAEKKLVWDKGETWLLNRKKIVVDRARKFQYSELGTTSVFYDRVYGKAKSLLAATSDETDLAWQFCDRAAVTYSPAKCSGSMTLEGVDIETNPLGVCVEGFKPRNVDLSTSPPALNAQLPAGGRWPLVIGVEYNVQAQEMNLMLDTYRVNPQKFMKRMSL